jgi:small multidrug resistance pump|tara:strand:- start:8622 stop:8798 length:177 start_codon:yes stop_codon:yes gene_type:complete
MKNIPMGITYASFAGLCILATSVVGVIRYGQIPNLSSMLGMFLIIAGVLIVNLLGKTS